MSCLTAEFLFPAISRIYERLKDYLKFKKSPNVNTARVPG